jgi:hypothetical protein
MFEEDAQNLVEIAQLLADLVNNWRNVEEKVSQITDLEHEGDEITHRIVAQLHRTFVTPLDREDISHLANALDDVADFVQASADAMLIYKVGRPTQKARELADIITKTASEVALAIPHLRRRNQMQRVLAHCVELNRLENEADKVFRSALAELFDNSASATEIIKWQEIYEDMEGATDRCEDVANILEGIALKYA